MKENKSITISARITPSQSRILTSIALLRNEPINSIIQQLIDYAKFVLVEAKDYTIYDTLIEEMKKKGGIKK